MLTNLPEIPRNQRIVLVHTQGPFAGLHQIMGHTDQFGGQQPPALSDIFDMIPDGRKGQASLIKSTPRAVFYREIAATTGLGTFDRAQR